MNDVIDSIYIMKIYKIVILNRIVMRKCKFHVITTSTLLFVLLGFSSCDFINSIIDKDDSSNVAPPSLEEQKEQRRQEYRDNIAEYVKLDIHVGYVDDNYICIENHTEYTLESVTVALNWKEYDYDLHKDISHTDTRTFTLIPANGKSLKIDVDNSIRSMRGQITSITCRAIGFY